MMYLRYFHSILGALLLIQFRNSTGFYQITSLKLKHGLMRRGLAMNIPLSDRIRNAVQTKYDPSKVGRVIRCWDDFISQKKLHRFLDDERKVLQTADCFVESLDAKAFYDTTMYPWIPRLEANYLSILDELVNYEADLQGLSNVEGSLILHQDTEVEKGLWLGPRDTSGDHYGPEWKTLGLQDRSVWNEELVHRFPRTIQLLQDLSIPSCEVFFAKQGPHSGLKPHSDRNNFIITCHLGLDVPEGECFITVGGESHYWRNGKTCVFDTSVIHSTENKSDKTRYVLLIRMWHHDLSAVERDAFKFIFEYLDHAAFGDEVLEEFEMKNTFMGKDNHKGIKVQLPRSEGKRGVSGKRRELMEELEIKSFKQNKKKVSGKAVSGSGFGKK